MCFNACSNLFLQLTVLWKLVENILMPKPRKPASGENKPPGEAAEGMKWSVAPGTNLLSGFTAKIFRESKQTLNEFAKELRSFRSVDMSGMLNHVIFLYKYKSQIDYIYFLFAVLSCFSLISICGFKIVSLSG